MKKEKKDSRGSKKYWKQTIQCMDNASTCRRKPKQGNWSC